MTVNELIASLREMQDKGKGECQVVYKDSNLYYQCIEYGCAECAENNGDHWKDSMRVECMVPSFVKSKEDFFNLIILE